MTIEIWSGASTVWRSLEACRIQAEQWAMDEAKKALEQRVVELAVSWGVKSVLDIGCGTGRYFLCLGCPEDYVGIDQSPQMLTVAEELCNGATFIRARAETIMVPKAFDLGLVMHVAQHVADPLKFLRSILAQYQCRHWIFTVLTVPGEEEKMFNIDEEAAALALPIDYVKGLICTLGPRISGFEEQLAVGVAEARELLAWT